ncbi:MAG: tetratricopeptide repeat protein [Candidatus Omnitrophica bacterium]|nr:tetratricopeptide repeat protein [Candidatus Omnitrophota bacterium]
MRKLILILLCLWAGGFFSPAQMAYAQNQQEELYSTALRAFDDGFHDVAIRYLEQFLQDFPQDPKVNQVKFLLGQCYFFKNQLPKALDLFNSLSDTYDNKELLLFWLGEVYLKIPDYAHAQKEYRELIHTYPDSVYIPQAIYSLGWSYFDQKKYTQAKDIFDQLVAQFPKHQLSEDALLKSGQCLYDAGDYRGALTRFMKYLTRYPQSSHQWEVYLNIADAYYYMEDYTNSKDFYHKSLKAPDPKLVFTAYIGKIWSSLKAKDFNSAEKTLKEAQDFSKDKNLVDDDLLLVKANVFIEKGDLQTAVGVYDELIKNFPQGQHYSEAHLGRANAYFILKKFDEALGDYRFVVDRGGQEELLLKANLGMAWTYVKLNNLAQAQARFQSIVEHTDKAEVKVNALVQMADALADADKMEEAVRLYDDVIKNYPDNTIADYVQHRQAIALLKMGNIQAAVVAFENLQASFPQSHYLDDVNYYLGLAAFKKGNWKTASGRMEEFLKSLSHPSGFTPEANYILALSYLNLKQSEEALKIFQKILRLYPDDVAVAKNSDIGIAKCQYELGQIKEAVKRFRLIIYKYPKTEAEFESLLWLAQYYLKDSDYTQAGDFYQQILDRFADHIGIDQIHYEMGQVYEIQGMYDQALVQYQQISRQDTTLYSKVKLAIAGIFVKEFDIHKAVKAYENIAATSPELARESYLKMAQLYRNNQTYDKEMECYQKALSLPERGQVSNVELLFDIADTYEVMGRLDEAVGDYLKIPGQYSNQLSWVAKAYLRVAKIFEDRQDWAGAAVTYQKIIQLNTEESKFAQERLDWVNSNTGAKK